MKAEGDGSCGAHIMKESQCTSEAGLGPQGGVAWTGLQKDTSSNS